MNDLSDTSDCLCAASRLAARSLTRAFDRVMRDSGLRVTQFSLLVQLMRRGELPVGRLAEVLGVERTTLTRNLALIERRRLVRIRSGDDPRERIVAITPQGEAAVTKALPLWRKAQADAADVIGKSGVAALRALAQRVSG